MFRERARVKAKLDEKLTDYGSVDTYPLPPRAVIQKERKTMPFKLYHNDKLIATFEDPFMESLMANWESQYVSGRVNMSTQVFTIWVENKIVKKEAPIKPAVKKRRNKNLKSV